MGREHLNRYGDNGRAGAQGESTFVAALRTAFGERWGVYTSLRIPAAGSSPLKGDVDVVVAAERTLVLVDVKLWEGQASYFSVPWFRADGLGPGIPSLAELRRRIGFRGVRYRRGSGAAFLEGHGSMLSANMVAARDRYARHFGEMTVHAMVVFVPHRSGSLPASVRWLVWPGLIRSFLAGDGLGAIASLLADQGAVSESVDGRLRALTR